jgi:hypothetical protein
MSVVSKISISRRKALGGIAAATAATVALPGMARAIGAGGDLNVFRGRYVFHGDRMIDGYMVSPRGTRPVDTVVLVHGAGGLDAAALATARRYAATGKIVVVPDLAATYRGAGALAGRDAHIADIRRSAASFGRHARGTGKVEVIAA